MNVVVLGGNYGLGKGTQNRRMVPWFESRGYTVVRVETGRLCREISEGTEYGRKLATELGPTITSCILTHLAGNKLVPTMQVNQLIQIHLHFEQQRLRGQGKKVVMLFDGYPRKEDQWGYFVTLAGGRRITTIDFRVAGGAEQEARICRERQIGRNATRDQDEKTAMDRIRRYEERFAPVRRLLRTHRANYGNGYYEVDATPSADDVFLSVVTCLDSRFPPPGISGHARDVHISKREEGILVSMHG